MVAGGTSLLPIASPRKQSPPRMHAEDIVFAILELALEAAALKGRRYKGS